MISRIKNKLGHDGIGARAGRSAALTILNIGGTSGLRLATNLILTRLLFPEAFGLMALIQVVLTGTTMFSDFGLRDAVIQDDRGEEKPFLDTAFVIQYLRGFALGAIVFFLAGPTARFFEAPELEQMLRISAIIPVMQGFNSIGIYTAAKHLLLGSQTVLVLLSQIIGAIVMVVLAFTLQSVWALVYGTIAAAFSHAVLSHVFLPVRTKWFTIEKDSFSRIFRYGKYIFLATIASFFVGQGDKLLLGKFVTLEELAIYNIAFFLASVPLILALAVNQRVMFPLYKHVPPSESAENRAKIDKARFLYTATLLTGLTLLALIGDFLIRFLYDSRYYDAGPILILVALAGMPRLIFLTYEKVCLTYGNSRGYAIYTACTALLQFGLMWFGLQHFGLIAAIFAPTLAALITYPFLLRMIAPYKAWSKRHDIIFGSITAAILTFVLWVHGDTVANLI